MESDYMVPVAESVDSRCEMTLAGKMAAIGSSIGFITFFTIVAPPGGLLLMYDCLKKGPIEFYKEMTKPYKHAGLSYNANYGLPC